MAHRRAKLTPFGRLLLAQRFVDLRWTVAEAAKAAGVSRSTAHKWVLRYREEGQAGLADRSSRAHRCLHAVPPRTVQVVLRHRATLKRGPHHLAVVLGMPRSTVYGILRRHGVSRLDHTDRPTGATIRYEKDRPGELVHIDVKKLGRVPPGGGHRLLGRNATTEAYRKRFRPGYDYLHACVDDHSRLAFVEIHPDERGPTCAAFLARAAAFYGSHGIRIEEAMTDNALNYVRSAAFLQTMAALAIRHRRIPPYHPRANGKVERFNRTMAEEWAYVRLYTSNAQRLRALPRWLEFYNQRRPHTALGGQPPISRV